MKRHAWNIAAFVWGFAEGTLFFIVPDVLLSWIGLKQVARPAAIACVFAALGAAVGGVVMYLWSASAPQAAQDAVLAVPAISNAMAESAFAHMRENWFTATLAGPLSRTPYKVYAIYAPHVGAPLWAFAIASIFARLPRFLVVSLGTALIRRWLEPRVGLARLTWVYAIVWIVFYAAFFALTPG